MKNQGEGGRGMINSKVGVGGVGDGQVGVEKFGG